MLKLSKGPSRHAAGCRGHGRLNLCGTGDPKNGFRPPALTPVGATEGRAWKRCARRDARRSRQLGARVLGRQRSSGHQLQAKC